MDWMQGLYELGDLFFGLPKAKLERNAKGDELSGSLVEAP
jgi:hypothetical protein